MSTIQHPPLLRTPAPAPYFHHLLLILQMPPPPKEVIKIYFPPLKKREGLNSDLVHWSTKIA